MQFLLCRNATSRLPDVLFTYSFSLHHVADILPHFISSSDKPRVKQYKINDQQKRQNAKKLPNTLYGRLFLLFSFNKFLNSVRSVFFVHLASYCWIEHIIDVDVAVFSSRSFLGSVSLVLMLSYEELSRLLSIFFMLIASIESSASSGLPRLSPLS